MRARFAAVVTLLCFTAGIRAADESFFDAIARGETAAVRSRIEQGVDPNLALPDGNTALHVAAQNGRVEIVQLLLEKGASPAVRNRYGVSPLLEAIAVPGGATAAVLLKNGASANDAGPGGETALMMAARLGNLDAALALVNAGADLNAVEPLHDQSALTLAAGNMRSAVVRMLVDRGARVDMPDRVIQPLMRRGRQYGEQQPPQIGGMTALMYAARQGDRESVDALLKGGANVNGADVQGWTPLLFATANAHYELAAFLVDKGADPNRPGRGGWTPLFAAADAHTRRRVSGKPLRPEQDRMTNAQLATRLLARGADPNALLPGDSTPFLVAASNADVVMMRALLAGRADAKRATHKGTTALMQMARMEDEGEYGLLFAPVAEADFLTAIDLCLKAGVNINAANNDGDTALHGAARAGDDNLVEALAKRGANLKAVNAKGLTAIDVAAGKGVEATPNNPPVEHKSTIALLTRLRNAK